MFNLHQISVICHQSYVFDDSINVGKLLDWKCLFRGYFKSITVIWNILHLFLFVDKMVQRVWLNKLNATSVQNVLSYKTFTKCSY